VYTVPVKKSGVEGMYVSAWQMSHERAEPSTSMPFNGEGNSTV